MKNKKSDRDIPLWARVLLRFMVEEEDYDQFCGDLGEAYHKKRVNYGKHRAIDFLIKQLFSSFPKFVIIKIYWGVVMFRNYFKIASRNFNRNKVFTIINVAGLACGIALVLYVLLFVDFHLSYDRFHANIDRIYQVGTKTKSDQGVQWSGANMSPVGEVLRNEYPQAEAVARMAHDLEPTIKYGDKVLKGHTAIHTESSFFKIMNLPVILGDTETPLDRKNTLILTRSFSRKLFGDETGIGKIIKINEVDKEVTAIIEDYPPNTDFKLDLYLSWKDIEDFEWFGWRLLSRATLTYVKLKKGVNAEEFESLIADMPAQYCSEEMAQKKMEVNNFLIPFKDTHLYTLANGFKEARKALTYVYILSAVGLMVLLVACMNFMNLSTARSALRSTEVGLRKVIGAKKSQLIKQFLSESIIMALIASMLAIALLYIFIPYFNELTDITVVFSNIWKTEIMIGIILVILVTGVVSGLYPAFYLSRFSPVIILKGESSRETGGVFLRRILVIGQFIITVTLIFVTLVMFEQVYFMKGSNLGFDKEQKLIIKLNQWEMITDNFESVKNELISYQGITKATAASGIPGEFINRLYVESENNGVRSGHGPRCLRCDYDFIDFLGINMLAGRFFEKERVTTPTATGFVINEKASKLFGFASPRDALGQMIYIGGTAPSEIIGVTPDFHWVGLQSEIEPLVMRYVPSLFRYVNLQLDTENIPEVMEFIETKYSQLFPGEVFEYMFVDKNFEKMYREEERITSLFTTITLLGIGIACLGLLGLAAFVAERKTKEIGIRKVLGASAKSVVLMLTKEFARWIIIASVIAWPLSYYVMDYWLRDFAYRISISPMIFIWSFIIAFIVAVSIVVSQTLRAAFSNPVNSIRYE